MVVRLTSLVLLAPTLVVACQDATPASARTDEPAAIIARARSTLVAQVTPGHPCRATVDGVELIVGTSPFVAQHGADRFTAQDASNGTTFFKNDQPVARIHARQLFDHQGIPLVRVLDSGDITDSANAIVRRAVATTNTVTVGDLTVTGTSDVVLAAMLTAREAAPEVRALVACHLLLPRENRNP